LVEKAELVILTKVVVKQNQSRTRIALETQFFDDGSDDDDNKKRV